MKKRDNIKTENERGFFRKYLIFPLVVGIAVAVSGAYVRGRIKPDPMEPPLSGPSQLDADKLIDLNKQSLSIVENLLENSEFGNNEQVKKLNSILLEIKEKSKGVSESVRSTREMYSMTKNYDLTADFYLPAPGGTSLFHGQAVFGISSAPKDGKYVYAKLNGKSKKMNPGDRMLISTEHGKEYYVGYIGKGSGGNLFGFIARPIEKLPEKRK